MSLITSSIEPEEVELFTLELGKVVEFDFVNAESRENS